MNPASDVRRNVRAGHRSDYPAAIIVNMSCMGGVFWSVVSVADNAELFS